MSPKVRLLKLVSAIVVVARSPRPLRATGKRRTHLLLQNFDDVTALAG